MEEYNMRSLKTVFSICLLAGSLCCAKDVHRWGMYEVSLASQMEYDGQQQYVDLELEFIDTAGKKYLQRGFWDGGHVWKVRFAPGAIGAWNWRSRCKDDPSLDGMKGSFACIPYRGDNRFYKHGPVRVSGDGHYLTHEDGTPFFWLVDTAWNGALKSAAEDWDRFLEDRSHKQFTGIQYVATQWRTAYANAEGQKAYTGFEKIRINPGFFQRIDERTQAVNEKGLLAVPVLLWTLGSREHNPGQLPEDQAILLARYMTARLGAYHVSWFLPGDGNYFDERVERWKRIGRAVFDRPGHATATLHPQGMQWPWDAFLGEKWVSYLGYQSGHGDDGRTLEWIYKGPPAQKWNLKPVKPVINLEPPYEDHIAYQSRQRHTAYTVRRAVYWSLLNAPTAGTSYGAHGVWSWEVAPNTPQEHGGTGVAKPWHEAMALQGSTDMKHMADLFTSIEWWRLKPENSLVVTGEKRNAEPKRTHIVYTRDKNGKASLFIDGKEVAHRTVSGNPDNWEDGFRLGLANELTKDRPWLGSLYRVAVYDRVLEAGDVTRRFEAGVKGKPAQPLLLYTFNEGGGNIVRDTSQNGKPLDLKIDRLASVRWVKGGGLDIRQPVLIASEPAASKVINAVRRTQQITIETWLKSSNLTQTGPARILTLSKDTGQRNFTLGQMAAGYEVRFRTTKTSVNGEPAVATAGAVGDHRSRHVSASTSSNGDLAIIYCPVGMEISIKSDRLKEGLTAQWINPRSGQRLNARPQDRGIYRTPDESDWVLLFQ